MEAVSIIYASYQFLVILKRDNERIIKDDFTDFAKMRQKYTLPDGQPAEAKDLAAACYLQDNKFWIFHRHTVENIEEEKANPGDKLWLVMKYMSQDKDYGLQPGQGFKLALGDTVKFGRVRYKVIMMHSKRKGLQQYNITDRFPRAQQGKERRSSGAFRRRSRDARASMGSGVSLGDPENSERVATQVNLPRFQSQATHFDQGPGEDHRNSFHSYDMPDSLSGSRASSSSSNSSERNTNSQEEVEVGVEGLDNVDAYSNVNENTNLVALRVAEGSVVVPKYNSVAPHDSVGEDVNGSYRKDSAGHGPRDRGHSTRLSKVGLDLRATEVNLFAAQASAGMGMGSYASGMDLNEVILKNSNILQLNENPLAATQLYVTGDGKQKKEVREERRSKKNAKRMLKLRLAEQAKLAMEGKVCRICLGEENEGTDPLISPCKCAGTMSHIHLECLREWLNSKRTKKEGDKVITYCWKALECELCQVRFPGQVYRDGTIVTESMTLTTKQQRQLGEPVEILEFETPETDFIVVESVTLQNIRIVHVISMGERQFIRVGRGHDVDIRVTDISVSRFHARITRCEEGDFYVEDNHSKFGTLVQIRRPQ